MSRNLSETLRRATRSSRSWENLSSIRSDAECRRRQCVCALHGSICSAHGKQCTFAEYCAHLSRDVLAHIDLAAEARLNPRVLKAKEKDADDGSDSGSERGTGERFKDLEIDAVGGGVDADLEDDTVPKMLPPVKYLLSLCILISRPSTVRCRSRLSPKVVLRSAETMWTDSSFT